MCTPDVLTFDAHIRRSLRDGALVHATTDFVKSEVQDVYGLPDERVVRIYTGPLPIHQGDPDAGHRLAGTERYLVSLGTIEPRKNLPRLVAAFDAIAGDRPDLALVIAGPDGWGQHEYDAAVRAARHRDRIVRLGYISYDQRADLLAGATALAYPSIYEGFGFPPLEAMGVGIPVVASDSSALPESLGDAALLPDPLDTDSIADALARVVDDEALRATLVARGLRRATRYSWDDTATELAAVYHRLASS
jgi:glycosyltransferase involved in cell wall biosynthesis